MARVTAMLDEARSAGLRVHRQGPDLIVRGQAGLGAQARDLLSHKPLVLAVLDHEEECRGHERSEHLGQSVDWRLVDSSLVCCACHPALPADQGGEPVRAPTAGAGVEDQQAAGPACPMCGSVGACEGRIVTPEGGWVCLAAVADGVVRNGRLHAPGPPAAETGGGR